MIKPAQLTSITFDAVPPQLETAVTSMPKTGAGKYIQHQSNTTDLYLKARLSKNMSSESAYRNAPAVNQNSSYQSLGTAKTQSDSAPMLPSINQRYANSRQNKLNLNPGKTLAVTSSHNDIVKPQNLYSSKGMYNAEKPGSPSSLISAGQDLSKSNSRTNMPLPERLVQIQNKNMKKLNQYLSNANNSENQWSRESNCYGLYTGSKEFTDVIHPAARKRKKNDQEYNLISGGIEDL